MTHDSNPSTQAPSWQAGVVMSLDPEACLPAAADDVLAQTPQQLDLDLSEAGTQEDQDSEVLVRAPEVRSLVFDAGGAPETVSTLAPEIAAENRTGFGLSGSRFGAVPLRRLLMAGALIAALGLGWIGGWSSYHFLAAAPASPLGKHTLTVRPCSAGESACVTRRSDREGIRPFGGRKGAVPPNREVVRLDESSQRASKEAGASAKRDLLPNQRSASALIAAVLTTQDRLKSPSVQMPVPETRPATIEGWTVREIVGGKAMLEGPNGIFTVSRGDHLPGVGRIDSIVRWGKHWIAATSMGLISSQN